MNYVIKEPLGVVGCLPSWNVPFTGAIQKIAPALAAGNTIVLKAPDEAPLSTLLLGELIDEAGFPPGVVNILCGLGPQTGKIMVDHPDIRLISFTGSIPVGKQIMAAASRTMKRVVLELGGKSPFIVFADADIDRAAEYAARFGIEHQGQLCCAASKVLVERTVKDRFLQAYLRHLQSFKPGYPEDRLTDPMARIGPLFNERQYHRIEEYVRLGRETGKLLIGGKRIVDGKFAKGFYYEPTVFEIVDRRSPVCAEEIFGPVMAVVSFEDEAEALQLANETEYGLSSSVWTRDIGKIQRMTKQIEAGTVWVNTYLHFNNENPWGGMKASGIGREYGVYALESYLEYKNIWIQD
jgi:acyl-CoA reductase-like NAD-dependent aldehyde dehydrogenase